MEMGWQWDSLHVGKGLLRWILPGRGLGKALL